MRFTAESLPAGGIEVESDAPPQPSNAQAYKFYLQPRAGWTLIAAPGNYTAVSARRIFNQKKQSGPIRATPPPPPMPAYADCDAFPWVPMARSRRSPSYEDWLTQLAAKATLEPAPGKLQRPSCLERRRTLNAGPVSSRAANVSFRTGPIGLDSGLFEPNYF